MPLVFVAQSKSRCIVLCKVNIIEIAHSIAQNHDYISEYSAAAAAKPLTSSCFLFLIGCFSFCRHIVKKNRSVLWPFIEVHFFMKLVFFLSSRQSKCKYFCFRVIYFLISRLCLSVCIFIPIVGCFNLV